MFQCIQPKLLQRYSTNLILYLGTSEGECSMLEFVTCDAATKTATDNSSTTSTFGSCFSEDHSRLDLFL